MQKLFNLHNLHQQRAFYLKIKNTPGLQWLLAGEYQGAVRNYEYVSENIVWFKMVIMMFYVGMFFLIMIPGYNFIHFIDNHAIRPPQFTTKWETFLGALPFAILLLIMLLVVTWSVWKDFLDAWIHREWKHPEFYGKVMSFGIKEISLDSLCASQEEITEGQVPEFADMKAKIALQMQIRRIRKIEEVGKRKHENMKEFVESRIERAKADLEKLFSGFKNFRVYPKKMSLALFYTEVDQQIAAEKGAADKLATAS